MTGPELTTHEDSGAVAGGPATEYAPAGGGGAIASHVAPAGRRQEIEAIMRTDFDRYESEGLDKELFRLIEADLVEADPDKWSLSRLDWQEGRQELSETVEGRRLIAEWGVHGAFRPIYEAVQRIASDVVRAVGDARAQRVFLQHFDQDMSESTRLVVYRELAAGVPGYVQPADAAALAKFGASDVGRELLAEWGADGPRRVATAWKRAERVTEALGDDADTFFEWFNGLPPAALKAIMRAATR